MNSISKWLCSSSTKKLFVKIVHPGGHVELHDRPILAAEVLGRNPKCCVAHPTVFQQPYDVVSPETTLMLGRRYYVVPLGTIRKLQLKHPPPNNSVLLQNDVDAGEASSSTCWLFNSSSRSDGNRDSRCLRNIYMSSVNKNTSGEEMRRQSSVRKRDENRGSGGGAVAPGRLKLVSRDNWQPGLDSVAEDY